MSDIVHPADLVIVTELVQLPNGGKLVVRGLNGSHLTHILRKHAAACEELFHLAKVLPPATSQVDLVADLMAHAEPIAMEVIACAIGGPQYLEAACDLPPSVQLTILITCFNLTVEKEGGLEKLVESVIQIIGLLSRAKALLLRPSGSQDSGGK